MQPTLATGEAATAGEAIGLAAGLAIGDAAAIGEAAGLAAGEGDAAIAGEAAGAVVGLPVGAAVGAAVDPPPQAVSSSGATRVTQPRKAARREIRAGR